MIIWPWQAKQLFEGMGWGFVAKSTLGKAEELGKTKGRGIRESLLKSNSKLTKSSNYAWCNDSFPFT